MLSGILLFNQKGEKVMTMIGLGIYGRRPVAPPQ